MSVAQRPNTEAVLGGLKDFQRRSVDYVFRRLYLDADATRRFLVADEVGLGKTLVARGLIARVVDHLWDKVKRVDVVYICSNADIARQNINRLKISGSRGFALTSRITLLPTQVQGLKQNRLNFISFTPGTSFDLRSRLGHVKERVLLCWLLRAAWRTRGVGVLNLLQGDVSRERFRRMVRDFHRHNHLDASLVQAFVDRLRQSVHADRERGREDLRSRFEDLARRFGRARKHIPREDRDDRRQFVGDLRLLLAETCLEALEPDLIILDEFQRFKHLLDGEDDASKLAEGLFSYADEHSAARVVLLSATPYRMYTLDHESGTDDHYQDFLRTVGFLLSDEEKLEQFRQLLDNYRRELLRLTQGTLDQFTQTKRKLEEQLRRVMVRTERLSVSEDRDGMLRQVPSPQCQLAQSDLESYVAFQQVARALDHHDVIEYWKSAPYLLNFMDEYKLKRAFSAAAKDPRQRTSLSRALLSTASALLDWQDILSYAEVDPCNARLRALMADTVGRGAWRLLWIAPALPYYEPSGPFAEEGLRGFTKRLVFSSWHVVPKVAATLLSYEAENRMMRSSDPAPENSPEARQRRTPLLRFNRAEERLTGMPVLGMLYPSTVLARECDPLDLSRASLAAGAPPSAASMLDRAQGIVERLLAPLLRERSLSGPEDETWYWAAPILLDLERDHGSTREWFAKPDLALEWSGSDDTRQAEDDESVWSAHVVRARDLLAGRLSLGRPPADLSRVVALLALAGPGVTSLRALSRAILGSASSDDMEIRTSAGRAAWAFLRLLNTPETMALLRRTGDDRPYWLQVLEYCFGGNLQATLDEYSHVLRESLGLLDQTPGEMAGEMSSALASALGLRTSVASVDDITIASAHTDITIASRRLRTHFALRFGEDRTEDGRGVTRPQQVRDAFNSPFWPFVLVTTSIGQEGLDFHSYCHAVCHWNLPANPVDLEQREGRVHRYKGHAIRKNLAMRYGLASVANSNDDPWQELFSLAVRDRTPGHTDLVPFWVYPVENGAKIERHVLAVPLSREQERIVALRRSLAVYRLVFGQNRQEDLLAYLVDRFRESELQEIADSLRMDLAPPAGRAGLKRPHPLNASHEP